MHTQIIQFTILYSYVNVDTENYTEIIYCVHNLNWCVLYFREATYSHSLAVYWYLEKLVMKNKILLNNKIDEDNVDVEYDKQKGMLKILNEVAAHWTFKTVLNCNTGHWPNRALIVEEKQISNKKFCAYDSIKGIVCCHAPCSISNKWTCILYIWDKFSLR